MANVLDNLSELIDRHLPAKGMNREDLARALDVSPSTLSRWSSRMPGPETVRALAAALDVPHGVVLAAALRSGGYAESPADILAGHSLTLVARDPAAVDTDYSDVTGVERAASGDVPGAVFTGAERAAQWARVQGQLDWRAGYENDGVVVGEVVIDGAATPEHITVYRAIWEHRTDTISVAESGVFPEVPSGLDPETAVVDALSDTGQVFAVASTALDAGTARRTVEGAVSRLRAEGKLLDTDEPTGLQWTDHIIHSELVGMRVHTRERREELSDEEPQADSAVRARIGELASKLVDAPRLPYVWGGGAETRDADKKPWRDPIRTYRVEPRADKNS
ncbi:hypothetical protein ACT17_22750 [Mycolicibacterium conceptionense]|uniref:HTH cro/C1-type domain-containing protein n=1 Tax=Mycolicibacterium conceptionense TaxID=451644 RepID=A0A0J8WSD5_9MYCO|nr:helix-turn-helix transcriptional regulator [Mycolicibacterium conceptionense]KMV15919.1 hypothetical protein ACT17_22750 [Mycolicibacterium conceptionense]